MNRCRVGAAVAGRAGNARRRFVWPKKLAGMLAEPGPMDEPTIAGATSGSRRLPDTPPPDALFSGTEFREPGRGLSVMSLFCRFW